MRNREIFPQNIKKPNADQEAEIFAAELGGAPSIDLHGLNRYGAERELDTFLDHAAIRNQPVVKIIHGRGNLVLRNHVAQILATHPLVEAFRGSEDPRQANGVTYAILSRLTSEKP